MKKLKKIISVMYRYLLKNIEYIDLNLYMKMYTKYLKKIGIDMNGDAKYISNSVYFDGTDYEKIHIGNNITISREVMLLTHDYSITTALSEKNIYIERNKGEYYILDDIQIGDNCFIGARTSILPGTKIGNNVIIGACSVVKGNIPDGVIIAGNPCKIIGYTKEYAERKMKSNKIKRN